LSYFFGLPAFKEHIRAIAVGATMPSLNTSILSDVLVPHPPSTLEQRAIADILGTLDDKIELNRKMNETLEALARALFKSWFVDFDPVRAKAEGRDPGLSAHIAADFPDSFEDSILGETPKGWRIGRLDDLLVLQRGFDLPKAARTDGSYPVLAASGPSGTHNHFMVRGPGVTTGRSGVLGNVFYVQEDFWPLNTSLWVKEFKNSSPTYVYYLLRLLDLHRFNAGSAVPTLNRNHIHGLPVVIPPANLVGRFEDYAAALLRRQRANALESSALAGLRDLLLPKLISGEMCVGDFPSRRGE
jgi:type I restriction enzyme S subunit